ncbi:MAG TPA: NAD(P)-dependent oxidoreductase [Solirubrobacteraceae bacterium]|jgi:nucleoside-diphosphate-sugar epimerase
MTAVIVTGASGFVGLPVLRELARTGREVHAVSTRATPVEVAGVRWHRLDLGDAEAVGALIDDVAPEQLVHLAWYVEHGMFWDAPENVLWVERSLSLLRAFARGGGRRAVMLGSCAEYDWSSAQEPLAETSSPLAPSTLYGVAKDALRRLAGAYAARAEFEFAWGRLFFPYGPREPAGRLVPSVIRALLAGELVPTTTGRQRRDFLHVDDVAGALVALLDSRVVGPVNIASGEAVAVAETVERLARLVGRPELVRLGAVPDRPGDPPLLVADVARLNDEVGFRPRWTMSDGLADAVRWWQERDLTAAQAARRP